MQLAAVDLGSNSFRLEIARASGSRIEREGYWKETVRLAAGLGADERLTPRAIAAAVDCLSRMNERMRGMRTEQVRAIGTQTLRQATNANDFLVEAQDALGYPIEVISGREEARLVFEGCTHTLPTSAARRLVVDIGGASSEAIVGRGFEAERAESFRMGCLNTTLRFFPDGVIDRNAFRRAQVACAAEIEDAADAFSRRNWDEAYGSSGTIGAASVILRQQGWSDGGVTSLGLLKLRQALVSAGNVRSVRFDGIKPDRAAVLAGGVAVLSAIFETFGLDEMQPAKGALRVGVLYDLLGRREDRDVRDATVERIQQRFGVDVAQAARVAAIAAALQGALQPQDGEGLYRVRRAAALHEVGFAISHNEHHKHAAYLIEHADLPGFSTSDQERIGRLVLAQRGNLRKVVDLLGDPRRLAEVLALRLAVIACHARRDTELPHWTLKAGRTIEFGLDRDWLNAHPLTRYLLDEEAAQWEKVGLRFAVKAVA